RHRRGRRRAGRAGHPRGPRRRGLHAADLHQAGGGPADAVLRGHRAARLAQLRQGQLQGPVRGHRARAGPPRHVVRHPMRSPSEPPDYKDYVDALRATHPDLAEAFEGYFGIGSVIEWMKGHGLSRTPIDLVGQDEFEYDFVIELGPEGSWLVFGVT